MKRSSIWTPSCRICRSEQSEYCGGLMVVKVQGSRIGPLSIRIASGVSLPSANSILR